MSVLCMTAIGLFDVRAGHAILYPEQTYLPLFRPLGRHSAGIDSFRAAHASDTDQVHLC